MRDEEVSTTALTPPTAVVALVFDKATAALVVSLWPESKLSRVATLLCLLSADILSGDCLSCFIRRYLARGDLIGLRLGRDRMYSATAGLVVRDGQLALAPVGVEAR